MTCTFRMFGHMTKQRSFLNTRVSQLTHWLILPHSTPISYYSVPPMNRVMQSDTLCSGIFTLKEEGIILLQPSEGITIHIYLTHIVREENHALRYILTFISHGFLLDDFFCCSLDSIT